jgi:hypothetical protein
VAAGSSLAKHEVEQNLRGGINSVESIKSGTDSFGGQMILVFNLQIEHCHFYRIVWKTGTSSNPRWFDAR